MTRVMVHCRSKPRALGSGSEGGSGQARYINHNYDRDGNREHLTFTNDGARFRFYYDGLGRMSAVHDRADHSSADDLVVRYWHRTEGPRHVALFGSGPAGLTTGYYYDNVQRLAAIANDLPGPDASIGLAYNPAGQIVRRDLSNDAFAWSEASGGSLSYKANGLNQYDEVGSNRYSYDANGNLTGDGIGNYTYDVENRLVGSSNGARLVYDPLGRLAETSGGPAGTTRFLYDGDKLIAEYDGSNTLLRRYVHGPGTDEPVAVYEGPALSVANRRYLLADERGSIMALVPTDGSAPAVNTYDEWGRPGRDNKGRFGYTGQVWISELGLWYYKARFYSPVIGRFMQTDPIGYEGGMNLYTYAANDAVNFNDATGQAPNRAGATSYSDVTISLRTQNLRQIASSHLENNHRYFYTTSYGWIDIRHFATAAADVMEGRHYGFTERVLGFGLEVQQFLTESGNDYRSGFSSEDLPSNAAGIEFGVHYRGLSGRDLAKAFKQWALANGARSLEKSPTASLPLNDPSERGGKGRGTAVGSDKSTNDATQGKSNDPCRLSPPLCEARNRR